jgi:amino acid adenylation domain-containing protein
MKANKIYVPLDMAFPSTRLINILEDSQARAIICDQKCLKLSEEIVGPNTPVINVESLISDLPSRNPPMTANPSSVLAIYYTSGSTGKPKGVMINHRVIQHSVYTRKSRLPVTPQDRYGNTFSISFVASMADIFFALLTGATLFPFNPKQEGLASMLEWLQTCQITYLKTTVGILREMAAQLPEGENFPHLRSFGIGGQSIHKSDVLAFQKIFSSRCQLVLNYSTTEAYWISDYTIDKYTPITWEIAPLGPGVEGKEILILDEHNQPVSVGQAGEIAVRSRYLSSGYWRDPDLTRKKFLPDPNGGDLITYLTGDRGRLRPDGMLEHLGRNDFQIKIRGFRVEPGEVEKALFELEEVKDAVVLAQERPGEEPRLVAYIVPRNSETLSGDFLRQKLSRLLPEYLVPASYIFLESLPKTPTGKVDRNALPKVDLKSRPAMAQEYIQPRDDLERRLVQAWEEVLQVKPVGVRDDFFNLGGDSLAAMHLFVNIEKKFGERLPLSILLQASTVEAQAELLRREGWKPDWSPLVPLRVEGNLPPLYLMAPGGGNILTYRDLAANLDPGRPCYALQSQGIDGVQKPFVNLAQIAAHYLQEIKTIHKSGPYLLGGSSFGGRVAYEMAQQLQATGEQVALVVMFDTYGINYPRKLPGMNYRKKKLFKWVRNLQKHLANLWVLPLSKKPAYLGQRMKKIALRVRKWLKHRYLEYKYPMPEALKEVEMANRKARMKIEPPRFSGRLVLFRASQQPIGCYPDPTLGWGSLVGDRLEIYPVPGNHTTLIYEPRVRVLAEKLNQILAEISADFSPTQMTNSK